MFGSGWEAIYVNLGHVYRKQQRWEEAETVYFKALALVPAQPATYAALAFTFHLQVCAHCACCRLQRSQSVKISVDCLSVFG